MADQIIKAVIELMKCIECDRYLRPPIYYTHDGNICVDCKDEIDVIGPNDQLQNIGTLLEFPCCFENFGCNVNITWAEAKKHENDCPFRQFSCPACSNWEGTAISMKDHVTNLHNHLYLSQPSKFVLRNESKKLFLIHMQELYAFIYNCDLDSGLLWFTMKSVGPLEYASRRHYKINMKLNDKTEYVQRKQVEEGIDWEIDENAAIKIDISVLKTKLQLKNENVITLSVEIFSRTPLYNGNVDEGLLRDIECPVCQDYMGTPIYQCSVGHSFCSYCKPKLKSCPTCRGTMSNSRNFVLESICNKMYYKCMYADDGCTFASLPKDIITHESECNFGLYDCPFKTFIADCEWRGQLDQMSSHTLEEHGIKI